MSVTSPPQWNANSFIRSPFAASRGTEEGDGSALRGVPLRARELDRPHGLVANDPGIVAGLNLVRFPGTELRLAAVVGLHVQSARQDVSDVVGLTRVRLRNRLHAL